MKQLTFLWIAICACFILTTKASAQCTSTDYHPETCADYSKISHNVMGSNPIENRNPNFAPGDFYYINSNVGNPWGNTTNQAAMDSAFGAGNWTQAFFESLDPAVVFAAPTRFVFIDGSDTNASELNTFLQGNLPAIEAWVNNGGTLLLNSAPNEVGNINFGFNGTTLVYPNQSSSVSVVNTSHPAFIGPNTPTATTMTGNDYAHATISGTGYSNILVDSSNPVKVVLAEKAWGAGRIMVGGMTTVNFHSPAVESTNWLINLLVYMESLAVNAPVFNCPNDISVGNDTGICGATVNYSVTASDVEDGTLVPTQTAGMPSGSVFPVGTTLNTFQVTDSDGNTSTCSFNVTVNDTEAPTINCVVDITQDNDPGICGAVVTFSEPTVSDNCGSSVLVNTMPNQTSPYVGDSRGYWFTAPEDFIITALRVPTLASTADQSIMVMSFAAPPANYSGTSSYDALLFYTQQNPNAGFIPVNIPITAGQVIGILGVRGNTNSYTSDTTINIGGNPLTINRFGTQNDISTGPAPQGSFWTEPSPSSKSNVDFEYILGSAVLSTVQTEGLASGSTFPVGTTTNTFEVTDEAGNKSTCSFTVTVEDNEAPVINCVADVTKNTDPGICQYTVVGTEFDATFTENCSSATITNDLNGTATLAGEVLSKDENTIVWTVDDGNGQTATCTTVITVEDNEAPVINCVADAARDTDPGVCQYTVVGTEFDATFTDNCADGSITNDLNGTATLAGEILSTGDTTVIWTVDDGNGQTATCTTVITVTDNEFPIIACPADIMANTDPGDCFATVSFPASIAIDNCGIDTIVQTMGDPSGSQFPVGVHTIEYTATDVNGNASTCSFTITVTDNQAPVAVCQNITIQLDATGFASITAEDVDGGSTDQCGVATTSISQDTFDCSNVGDNDVVLTVTDVNGNMSTCTATVTVEDVTAPVVACQSITVELDPITGSVTINGTDIDNGSTDTCGIDTYELDIDTFDCSNIGENAVILTVTDVNGNSATCNATVTVQDNTSPVLVCQDFTLELGADGTATLDPNDVIASNDDACGILTVAVDITEYSCADIGNPVTVQIFSQDNNGNLSTCYATVTVVDTMAPVVTCPANQTVDPGAGNLFYVVPDYFATGEATAMDNCTDPVTTTTQDPVAGTAVPDGVFTVTLTATDAYGNVGSCEFELTVETVLGIGENNLNLGNVLLYPNPAKDQFTIGNPQSLELDSVDIYDLTGRMVKSFNVKGMAETRTFDVSNLASATYMVIIRGKQDPIVKRLLKE